MDASKLFTLLHMTWESPVFGDAYPLSIAVGGTTISQRIEQIHALLVARLAPILAEWMQPISPAGINEIIRQVAPKSTAFCAAIAAGEIDDVERLAQVGLSIALVYWADHCMDRGDMAMEQAILQRAGWFDSHAQGRLAYAPYVDTRMIGLDQLERIIRSFCRPEDAEVLIENVLHEVLCREVRIRELSRLYDPHQIASFWTMYAHEVAEHSIRNVALVYVSAAIYAIKRVYDPDLLPLKRIFAESAMMRWLYGPASALIRILDDLGDRVIDSGEQPEWGHFTLNIFNQPHPVWIEHFLHIAGIREWRSTQLVTEALCSEGQPNHNYVFDTFIDLVRTRFEVLPVATYRANQLFLEIGKRVIEAGYVNALGDIALAA